MNERYENEVWALQPHLPDCEDELQGMARDMAWYDWDVNCWHADNICIGQAIGDYQVIRVFDVEGEKIWRTVDYDHPETWEDWIDEDNIGDVTWEEEDEDGVMHTYADAYGEEMNLYGEFAQVWINVKDGTTIVLGKPSKETEIYCDVDENWVVCDETRHSVFHKRFGHLYCGMKTRYFDYSVHPELFKRGYEPMWIEPFEDLNYCEEAKLKTYYEMDGEMDEYIRQLISGHAYDWLCDKGIDRPVFVDADIKNVYRICRRNGYCPTDIRKYKEYIDMLVEAGNDTHNPHYICPDNIDEAYEALANRLHRQRAQQEEQRLAKELYEDKHKEEIFAKMRAPYLGIAFGNDKYDVHVLQSVGEYVEEGIRMHHCVGKNGYWKKTSSICMSIRTKEGERYATAELSLDDYRVLQLYGHCDKVLSDDREVRDFLLENAWRFKEATNSTNLAQAI